jgi:hypothetical protein
VATGTLVPPTTEADRGTRADVEREFLQEDEWLLRPLLKRIDELADLVDHGEPVDPAYLRQGIELWSRYDTEVDARRVGRVLAVLPESTYHGGPIGPSRSRWHLPGRRRSPWAEADATLRREYQEILHEQRTAPDRINALRTLVELYAQGALGTGQRLALALKGFTAAEIAWAHCEEEFVLKSPDVGVTADTGGRVHRALVDVANAGSRLQGDIGAYLARPVLRTAAPPSGGAPATPRRG